MGTAMGRTFEEVASSEMDSLYQGALFLCGGDTDAAECLVVDTVMLAFREHAADADAEQTRRWLETRLVRSYLRNGRGQSSGGPRPTTARGAGGDRTCFDEIGPERLFQAAESVPPLPRSALWLVLMRRWRRFDASTALGVDADEMDDMLGYRDVLMGELLSLEPRRGEGGA